MRLKTINQIVILSAIVATMYLLGAFYSATFNIAEWKEVTRGLIVFITPCFLGMAILFFNLDNL